MITLANLITDWATNDGATEPRISLTDEGRCAQYSFSAATLGEDKINCWFDADEESRMLFLSMYAPDVIPAEQVDAVGTVMTLINDMQLRVGNFELSSSNNMVRFRIGVPVSEDHSAIGLLSQLFENGMRAYEMALLPIRKVAFGGYTVGAD